MKKIFRAEVKDVRYPADYSFMLLTEKAGCVYSDSGFNIYYNGEKFAITEKQLQKKDMHNLDYFKWSEKQVNEIYEEMFNEGWKFDIKTMTI